MGWKPDELEEAALTDLSLALAGYREYHGLDVSAPVSRAFLDKMINTFPDRKT